MFLTMNRAFNIPFCIHNTVVRFLSYTITYIFSVIRKVISSIKNIYDIFGENENACMNWMWQHDFLDGSIPSNHFTTFWKKYCKINVTLRCFWKVVSCNRESVFDFYSSHYQSLLKLTLEIELTPYKLDISLLRVTKILISC
jgi:hypothetical protein